MSDEPKIDDEILADDFADFLTRGLAAQRAVDEVIAARSHRCPRCDSPQPQLHPAVQHEGEVEICGDPWHVTS